MKLRFELLNEWALYGALFVLKLFAESYFDKVKVNYI